MLYLYNLVSTSQQVHPLLRANPSKDGGAEQRDYGKMVPSWEGLSPMSAEPPEEVFSGGFFIMEI